jgi:hypothetical protein
MACVQLYGQPAFCWCTYVCVELRRWHVSSYTDGHSAIVQRACSQVSRLYRHPLFSRTDGLCAVLKMAYAQLYRQLIYSCTDSLCAVVQTPYVQLHRQPVCSCTDLLCAVVQAVFVHLYS